MNLKEKLNILKKNKKIPVGAAIFGVILIVSSVQLISFIPSYDFYRQVNHEWPENIIKIRYVGSYIFKLIGFFSGIGVLLLNNAVRKFLVGFSVYSVGTLPLRHTYNSMFFFTEPIYRIHGSMFALPTFTWIAVWICWFIDGVFALSVIYYFTRPKVVEQFVRKQQT